MEQEHFYSEYRIFHEGRMRFELHESIKKVLAVISGKETFFFFLWLQDFAGIEKK